MNDSQLNTSKIRDRDYILDKSGNYLKVIGDSQPENYVVSYIKYFESARGMRNINGKRYGYNSFVPRSFNILKNETNRMIFSPKHGGLITATPTNEITQIFSAREKVQEILKNNTKASATIIGQSLLLALLDMSHNGIDMKNVGITGSFLIDANNDQSDIDLVCYGRETYDKMKKYFKESSLIENYEDGERANFLYHRRMIYQAPMAFDTLILQESRKLQGTIPDKKIHINCQPLREDGHDPFSNISINSIGEITCIAKITNASEGIYSPAIYEIEVLDMIQSLFDDDPSINSKVKYFISYIGAFSQCFEVGDRLYLEGKLIKVEFDDTKESYFGVELSPWNTSRIFKALLLR